MYSESYTKRTGRLMSTGFCLRITLFTAVVVCFGFVRLQQTVSDGRADACLALRQLDPSYDVGDVREGLLSSHGQRNMLYILDILCVAALGAVMFSGEVCKACKASWKATWNRTAAALLALSLTGCWRPFEPVKLEVIQTNEEAFLLPFTESVDKQTSTHTEDYLRKSLVHTQQVKIPQQWVPKGYETLRPNGEWKDAAILVRVEKSPVTREWTADPNSGTSSRNEAIWVMTSDQVEFSTGWTCTARIASREDAVKFLHNYPNGSLTTVMDGELRAKLQAEFGLEVTDLPMDELRKQATPHILKVTEAVREFFAERGITITNLGITGGFVYKDPSIIKMLVEVFNAEQKKAIAIADTGAQLEQNKKIQLEAEAKAKALLTERQAEADGIKLVADAKSYEIEIAAQSQETYLRLKQLELEKTKLEKWDGKFPTYFMGSGEGMNMLLSAPVLSGK